MLRKHKVYLVGLSFAFFILLLSTAAMGATTPVTSYSDTELPQPAAANYLAQLPPPPGMVSYWEFNEDGGALASDSIGPNDGTLRDGGIWVTGIAGSGVDLAPRAFVECGGDPSLSIQSLLTIEAWVMLPDTQGIRTIVQNGNDIMNKMYHFAVEDGFLYFDRYDGTNPANVYRSHVRVNPGEWHHVLVLMDEGMHELRFYIDGVVDPIGGFNDPYAGVPYSRFTIGYGQDPLTSHSPTFFNGFIDEVAVYNELLSDDDIQLHYQNGRLGFGYLEGGIVPSEPEAFDDSYTTDEDVMLSVAAPGVLTNDVGDGITAVLKAGPSSGTLSFYDDGSFQYTPAPDFNGVDAFIYSATDGATESNDATVTITVNAVNDAPIGVDDDYTIDEDTSLDISAPGLLANDYDVDGDVLTLDVITVPSHGSGSIGADGSFSFTPNADWYGTASMTYRAFDGVDYSGEVTVTIIVNPINDAPVAVDDYAVTDEDTPIIIDFMGNDYDVDDSFGWDYVSWVPSEINGELEVVYNYEVEPGVFRDVLRYTPNPDWHGSSSTINYRISDTFGAQSSIARIYITVDPVNDAPVAVDDYVVTDENTAVIIDFMANDFDIDGDWFDWAWMGYSTVELHGTIDYQRIEVEPGVFRTVVLYTPDPGWYGSTSTISYAIRDSSATESLPARIHITVNPANHPPVANDDAYSTEVGVPLNVEAPGVLANDEDIDGDTLEALLVDMPVYGTVTLNPDGSFTYIPAEAWCGVDTFTYYAFDGLENSNIATVTITVVDVTPPVTTIQFIGDAGEYDWYYSDVEVILTATDDCSGVASTLYSVNGSEWMSYIDPFVLINSGEYIIRYYSIDNAGNIEDTHTAVAKISKYTRGYVSGAGWILEADGSKSFFSILAKYRNCRGWESLYGHINYMFKDNEHLYALKVKDSQILGLIIDGDHAIIEAKGVAYQIGWKCHHYHYAEVFYIRIEVWDNGKGKSDVFQIRIFDEAGGLFHEAGFDPLGTLLRGSILIGPRNWHCWCRDWW